MKRKIALGAGIVIGAVAGLIGVELALLSRREFLPLDPGYRIDARVPAPDGRTEDPLRLAVLGDSTVAGVGSPTELESEPLRTMVDRYSGLLRGEQRAAVSAVSRARFVDLAEEASPRFLGRPEATSPDGFHPSPIGYGFWADALAPAVIDGLRTAPG